MDAREPREHSSGCSAHAATAAPVLVEQEERRKHDTRSRLRRLRRHSFGRRLGLNGLMDCPAIWSAGARRGFGLCRYRERQRIVVAVLESLEPVATAPGSDAV